MKTKDLADMIRKKRKEQKPSHSWLVYAMSVCGLLLIWNRAKKPVKLAKYYMFWICWELN